MLTLYIDAFFSDEDLEAVYKGGEIEPPYYAVSARTGSAGYILDEDFDFPFFTGNKLVAYSLEKRYGVIEPGILATNCVVPDASLTKDDLEQIRKGWL